jgi:hypothetical protein
VHIPDLKSVTGIKTARRYKTVRGKIPGIDLLPYQEARHRNRLCLGNAWTLVNYD